MHADEHDRLLHTAYRGEIIGEAIFAALGRHATTPHQVEVCRLLEEIELVTGNLMADAAARHGVICDAAAARVEGEGYVEAEQDQGWLPFWETLLPLAEDALAGMQRLRDLSDDVDRAAFDQLVAHEEAVIEFIRRERDQAPNALEPLTTYLADHGQPGAKP